MPTIVPFLPSNTRRFRFPALFDTSKCNVELTWNVSAQRYYINVYDSNGDWLLTTALVASPPARKIASVNYNPFRGVLIVTLVDPMLWPIPLAPGGLATPPGTIVDYTLESFAPNEYNGKFRGMHVNEITFEVPMPTTPGPVRIMGFVSRYLNMVGTIFKTSTLIYRNNAFEIGP